MKMPTIKRQFANDGTSLEQLPSFVNEYLRKYGIAEATAFNSTNLVRSITELMITQNPTYIGITIRKSGKGVSVRVSSDGPSYNPLDDLNLSNLMEVDPPKPDDDFDAPDTREQLLKALRDKLSYYHRHKNNVVEYVVRRKSPQTLKQVTIAFLLAIVTGLLLRYFASEAVQTAISDYILTPIRTMFLNALKMLIVPVVFFALSSSVAGVADIRDYGRIGAKTVGMYVCTSIIAIVIGFSVYGIFKPGTNVTFDVSAYSYTEETVSEFSIVDTIVDIIPDSFVEGLTGDNMLQVIVIAILVGIAANLLDHGDDRQKVSNALSLCSRLFLKLATVVLKFIPIATYCAMTLLILDIDTSMVVALVKFVLCICLGAVLMFAVDALFLAISLRRNPLKFFKKCIPNYISFITFCSTSAVMPQSLDTCTHKLGISSKVSSFSMPLGSTINMDGACIYLTVGTLFLAAVYGVELTPVMLAELAITAMLLSMGAAPVAGAGFICLGLLVQQFGIPIDSLGILMGIDQIMSMIRTLVNGNGDLVCTTVVAKSENMVDMEVFDSSN